jgi:hypothetical protein
MSWVEGGLAVAVTAVLAAWLVLGAVRRTVRRHERGVPPLPPCPPAGAPRLAVAGARYLGTTLAPSTLRRYAGHGLLGRGVVGLVLDRGGLRVERGGRLAWCIPATSLRGAEVASHHAGKSVGAPRVLVVDWILGETGLRSGFVLDAPAVSAWATALSELVPQ